jgi:uncharacterized protein (TIGR02271 family)
MREDEQRLPIIEERLRVAKKDVSGGKVRVRTRTTTETEALDVDLLDEEVDVERVEVGLVVDVAPQVRTEGDVTIVPVLEERLVVEKRLVLVEEIRIRRKAAFRTERVEAELRKQHATVERVSEDKRLKGEP